MVDTVKMLQALESVEELLRAQARLGKDAIHFIVEKNLWTEFFRFHCEKEISRTAAKRN